MCVHGCVGVCGCVSVQYLDTGLSLCKGGSRREMASCNCMETELILMCVTFASEFCAGFMYPHCLFYLFI